MKRTWTASVLAVLCTSVLASAFNEGFQYYAISAAPSPDGDFPFWYGCTIDLASFVSKAAPALVFALVWKRSGFLFGAIIGFLGSIGRSALYMSQHGVPLTAGNFPALLCTAVTLAIIACVAGGAGELLSRRFSNYSSKRTRVPRAA
jgi:hypothetical protein